MSNPWFKMHSEFAHDPKVQGMPEKMQRRLVILFCLQCCDQLKNLTDDDVAFALRITNEETAGTKTLFLAKGFISGDWQLKNWEKRQARPNSAYPRVKKFRDKRIAAGLSSQTWVKPGIRREVFARDGNECIYCKRTEDLTLDHKVPECRGGSNEAENLQVACRVCNGDKRHMTHDEYSSWAGRVTLLKPASNVTDVEPSNASNAPRVEENRTETDNRVSYDTLAQQPAQNRGVKVLPRSSVFGRDFEEDWPQFWYKTGRRAAFAKYCIARKTVSREKLMAAVVEQGPVIMARAKQNGITPVHPATWLHQGRWDDEPLKLELVPNRGSPPKRATVLRDAWEAEPQPEEDPKTDEVRQEEFRKVFGRAM